MLYWRMSGVLLAEFVVYLTYFSLDTGDMSNNKQLFWQNTSQK